MLDSDRLENDGNVNGMWRWGQGAQDILDGIDAAGERRCVGDFDRERCEGAMTCLAQ